MCTLRKKMLKLKADRPHPRCHPHTPADYRHTDITLELVMNPSDRRGRKLERTDRRTDRRTDATKYIISLASRSIMIWTFHKWWDFWHFPLRLVVGKPLNLLRLRGGPLMIVGGGGSGRDFPLRFFSWLKFFTGTDVTWHLYIISMISLPECCFFFSSATLNSEHEIFIHTATCNSLSMLSFMLWGRESSMWCNQINILNP